MKILITGGNGQLGRSLQRSLDGHDVLALAHADLEVSDVAAVSTAVASAGPDAVINCAALTDTTRCEREPALAQRINADGAANVARACGDTGALAVLISTDEVFDGTARRPYIETDETRAVNAYGSAKLEGERQALAANDRAIIVRTSWLYGDGGNNFPSKVIAAARSGRALRFVTNEVSVPTATDDLAAAIRVLIEANPAPGAYHIVSDGQASRFEWARTVLDFAGMAEVAVEPVTMQELRADGYDGPAKPEYSVLANTRARALGIELPPWRGSLARYIERLAVAADG